MQYFSGSQTIYNGTNKTLEEQEFMNFHLARLARAEDRRKLDATGFACNNAVHSIHCVSTKPVRIDMSTMTVYIPSSDEGYPSSDEEIEIRPYARQEDSLKSISPVKMIRTGNVFHEMNEIIIPLYITTKQFQSRIALVLEDYKPSFIAKYGSVLSHLSSHEIINPAANETGGVHCFPAAVVGLKYHDNLALNSSDIPGGYGMPEFRHFLRQAFSLKFAYVSEIAKPRLLLLSRTNTRRFLNEDEMIPLMKEVGFEVIVVKRSKMASNLKKFTELINSCSVLLGAHGAGLTNEIFLPTGAVMIQVELLGTEWASNTYYGDTARAMGVHYLRYKIEAEESSLLKLYGRNSSVVTDPGSVYRDGGYRAARTVFLDQQNVRVNLARFRGILVEALSIVTDWAGR
ncbi:hypothetical protein C2S51_009850 [Perilla frutescens var. frutescens]|nr:hypothetical protein C2S51_009850 [Perilla frutescens var. frutescens]